MAEGFGDSDARRQMLARVRAKLGVRGDEISRRARVHGRLSKPPVHIIPARAQKPRAELIRLFQEMLETAGAKVIRLRSQKALTDAVADILRERNMPLIIRCGDDPMFKALGGGEGGLLQVEKGPATPEDHAALSRAAVAAAETGTLFLLSGAANPSTLNFLPELHIVAIKADDIVGAYEQAWARLRQLYGPGQMPRTVNMISGPSRTADIEQTIVMGAHGPRALVVCVIGS